MTNRQWLNEISQLDAYKLIEAPYMADLLEEKKYYDFTQQLKQSEIEMANKIRELVDKVNELLGQSEHKEIPKISDAERVILENVDKKYFNYIARNKNGSLYLYFSKPNKNNDTGIWKELSYMHCEDFYMFKNLFQFITWNDSEPYNIEELLKGE